MKNFPHQVSRLSKLHQAAQIAVALHAHGVDISDAHCGDALARAGVYNFREPGDVEQLLAAEALKVPANQGSRTAARDFRRTLRLLGVIHAEGSATEIGDELLAAATDAMRNKLWRSALLHMSLGEGGAVSHPYRILLRLVSDYPGIESRKLLLALEANDDGEAEYNRILDLAELPFDEMLATAGITPASAANAVKILPSIAYQLGDLVRVAGGTILPADTADSKEIDEVQHGSAVRRTTTRRQATLGMPLQPQQLAPTPIFSPATAIFANLTAGVEVRKRRTEEHQELVREFAKSLNDHQFQVYGGVYDCLALRGERALLIEAKTLGGSPADERSQSEKAIGQLAGYFHFDLPQQVNRPSVEQVILFSKRPSEQTAAFLNHLHIVVVWPDNGSWQSSAPNVGCAPYGF